MTWQLDKCVFLDTQFWIWDLILAVFFHFFHFQFQCSFSSGFKFKLSLYLQVTYHSSFDLTFSFSFKKQRHQARQLQQKPYSQEMQYQTYWHNSEHAQKLKKCTETARTNCEDARLARWSLEIENNSTLQLTSTLNYNLLTNWRWLHATISVHTKSKFSAMLHRQCKVNGVCNWKIVILWLMPLRLSCSLHNSMFAITLRFWAPQKLWIFERGLFKRKKKNVVNIHYNIHRSYWRFFIFFYCWFGILMSMIY